MYLLAYLTVFFHLCHENYSIIFALGVQEIYTHILNYEQEL